MQKLIVFLLLTVLVAFMPGAAVPAAVRQVQTTGFRRYMMSSSQVDENNDIILQTFDATVDAASSQPAATSKCGKAYSAVGKLCGKQQCQCCTTIHAYMHVLHASPVHVTEICCCSRASTGVCRTASLAQLGLGRR
jgi:hypothetical protein